MTAEAESMGKTAPFTSAAGRVVRAVIGSVPIYFTITRPRDAIQREHRKGQFYEPEELEIIRAACPAGAVFCDIGTNIGNHTLFVLKFLNPAKVICFEPNPDAIEVLRSNLGLNGLLDDPRCDLSRLGFGLSDSSADGLGIEAPDGNLGGARMVEGTGGLSVRRGDDLLTDVAPTFLKIDVEGMELKVLAGLSATIAAHRPTIFVEVDRENATDFARWTEANGYSVSARFRRYRRSENFLLVPA